MVSYSLGLNTEVSVFAENISKYSVAGKAAHTYCGADRFFTYPLLSASLSLQSAGLEHLKGGKEEMAVKSLASVPSGELQLVRVSHLVSRYPLMDYGESILSLDL